MDDFGNVPVRLSGVIPNFFFDAIGRVVPGSYFLLRMFWAEYAPGISWLDEKIRNASLSDLVFVSVGILSMGYIAGFLLGAASYWLDWAFAKTKDGKLSLEALREQIGGSKDEQTRLERLFRERFGFDIGDHNIVECSWLCAYSLWGENPRLGSMSARWDAEALAARSISTASLLIAANIIALGFLGLSHWYYSLWFLEASDIAAIGFEYHRRMRVWGRFKLFISLPRNTLRPPN